MGRVIVDDLAVSGTDARPLTVRDLDRDGEPEVVVRLFWGSMRCCFWSRIYRFDRIERRFVRSSHFWGNVQDKAVTRDLDGDGTYEFVSRDGRFEKLAGTYQYIDPIQIWSYRRGDFADVTQKFPVRVRADARKMWMGYLRPGAADGWAKRGYLAAWAGDQYRLGRRRAARRVVARALRLGRLDVPKNWELPASPRWVADLEGFLERSGY